MNDQVLCRICFASDNVKLCSVFSFGLTEAYEKFVGLKVTEQAALPEYICSYCTTLLFKGLVFREKCLSAYNIIKYAAQNNTPIDQLDEATNFKLPYSISNNNPIINIEYAEPIPIKQELVRYIPFIEVKIENCEIKKKKKKKKKESVQVKTEVFSDGIYDNDNANTSFNDTPNNNLQNNDNEKKDSEINNSQMMDDFHNNDSQSNDTGNNESVTHELLDDVKIIILSPQEQIQEIEDRKTSSNYLNSSYKCSYCFKGFMMPSTFRNHMLKHDPERGELKCDICKSRFSELRSLRAHVVHTHERKYICKLCDHVSRSSHRAKEHAKWHNGFTFSCKICGATFAKSTSHLTHIRLQHPSENACDICGESFIGEFGLKMHKRKAHSSDPNQLTTCEQCNFKFTNVEALSRHLEYSKDEVCHPDLKPCTQCGEGFVSEEALSEHIKNDHKEEEAAFCHDCKRTFTSTRSYEIHFQRVHLGVKLKQRRRAACKRGESAVCEICGYKCISNATLIYHQRTHTGEKPYQCTECPKKFSVFQRLQIHLRTHTGETPYQCQHCPKAFKHKAALNRHDRVHTGAKPYSCQHCGKAFSQSNSMKLHVNTVHLKLPAPYRNRRPKIN